MQAQEAEAHLPLEGIAQQPDRVFAHPPTVLKALGPLNELPRLDGVVLDGETEAKAHNHAFLDVPVPNKTLLQKARLDCSIALDIVFRQALARDR